MRIFIGGGSVSGNAIDSMMLEGKGHEVDVWFDPAGTLDFVAATKYDILILDFSAYEDDDALVILKGISKAFDGDIFLVDVYPDSKLFKKSKKYKVSEIFPRAALELIFNAIEKDNQ